MKHIFVILTMLLTNNSFSQRIVLDKTTQKGIPYVNILVKNTFKGFYANSKGHFVLKDFIKAGDTLIFSSLGYESKEVIIGLGNKIDTISLGKKIEHLNEIVIKNHRNKYKTLKLGILNNGRNSAGGTLNTIQLAVLIKNESIFNKECIIKELVFRKLKSKFKSGAYDVYIDDLHFKSEKKKINNNLALKIQLYNIDRNTGFPNLESPLLDKDVFLKLDKNTRNLKYDVSSQNIVMPNSGVFLFLEILGVFNENGEIVQVKGNIFSFGAHKPKNKEKIVTYAKYKDRPWSKSKNNALFSLKVKYPID